MSSGKSVLSLKVLPKHKPCNSRIISCLCDSEGWTQGLYTELHPQFFLLFILRPGLMKSLSVPGLPSAGDAPSSVSQSTMITGAWLHHDRPPYTCWWTARGKYAAAFIPPFNNICWTFIKAPSPKLEVQYGTRFRWTNSLNVGAAEEDKINK